MPSICFMLPLQSTSSSLAQPSIHLVTQVCRLNCQNWAIAYSPIVGKVKVHIPLVSLAVRKHFEYQVLVKIVKRSERYSYFRGGLMHLLFDSPGEQC